MEEATNHPTTEVGATPPSPQREATKEEEKKEEVVRVTPTPTPTKQELQEKGTPVHPIPIEEMEEERVAAAAERATRLPVLRRSMATRVSLFTKKEKES